MSRAFLAFLLASALSLPLAAQERTYAIMSLVGDSLLIAHQAMSTGSRLDRNQRELVAVNTPALDNALVLALDDELKLEERGAKTVLLAARDPELFKLQSRSLEDGTVLAQLLPILGARAKQAGATHLILAVKHRDEARVRLADGRVGSGRLEGFGFYLDHNLTVVNRDTGEQTQGFISTFAFFRLALVDLATGKVLREEVVRESQSVANQKALGPWNAITAEQKVRILTQLIRQEAQRALPALLAR